MLKQVYLNGAYLNQEDARLHVSDLSMLRGYGVFDYFRYAARRPRFIEDHLVRFARSASLLGLPVPLASQELAEVILALIERNDAEDGGIRLVLTGGYATDGYTPVMPNLLALPYAFTPPPAGKYATGCSVVLHRYTRQLPEAKTIDYIEGIRIQPMLRQRGADYPLYVDGAGRVRESDRSNFFIVQDGELVTPGEGILFGITRKHLIAVALELGIPVREGAVSVADVLGADEAIMCSSVKEVMPITRIDGQPVGDGAAGGVTTRLMQGWREYIQ